jgi:acyl-CoA thioesterase
MDREEHRFTHETLSRINDNPLYQAMGIRIEEAAEGKAGSRLEPTSMDRWPAPEQPHGGVLYTLMDTTMAWAVTSTLGPGSNCATVHASIHYMRSAKGKLFRCSARVTHRTRRLSFVQAEIHDAGGNLIAGGQATFAIIGGG